MTTGRRIRLTLMGGVLAAGLACTDSDTVAAPPPPSSLRREARTFDVVALSPAEPQNPALVDLGRSLFFDRILSGNRDVSCATCHDPSRAMTDGRSLPVGTGAVIQGGRRVPGPGREYVSRNAPSILNLREVDALMWDGRIRRTPDGRYATPLGPLLPRGISSLLAAQAMFPVLSRVELRGERGDRDVFGAVNELAQYDDGDVTGIWNGLMRRLLGIDAYVAKFRAAYPTVPPEALGFEHAANAIAAFEIETFTRNDTPFDRFLRGDDGALSAEAKAGATLFFQLNCQYCHTGAQLGGQELHATGVPQIGPGVAPYAPLDGGAESRLFAFRVPPLRNVALTAPYGHSGAYASLEAMLRHYKDVPQALRSYDPTQLEPGLRSSWHGDDATRDHLLAWLDGRLARGVALSDPGIAQLTAFLGALTDPSVQNLGSVVPTSVPSGLPVR